MGSLREFLDSANKAIDKAKEDAGKQWEETKKLGKKAIDKAKDAAVIDEENIPSKSIPRYIDKVTKKKEEADAESQERT